MAGIFTTDMMSSALPFAVPLVAALVIYIVDIFWHDDDKDVLVFPAVLALLAEIALLWRLWMAGGPLSRTSIVLLITVLCLAIPFILSAHQYYQLRNMSVARFVVVFLCGIFGISVAIAVDNLLAVSAGLVITSLSFALLIKLYGGLGAEVAARKFWLCAIAADGIFIFGVAFFFGSTGRFDLNSYTELIPIVNKYHTGNYFRIFVAAIAASMFTKIAAVPFHWWVLDVARLRSLPVVSTVLFFLRGALVVVTVKLLAPIAAMWGGFFEAPVRIVAVLTMVVAGLATIGSSNLKFLLASSSVVYIGYILSLLPALVLGGGNGVVAVQMMTIVFVLAHFGVIAGFQAFSGDGDDPGEISSLSGMSMTRPWVALTFGIFFMAMAGLPPSAGFLARFLLVREMLAAGDYIMTIFVLFGFAIALFYASRPVFAIYFGKPEGVGRISSEISYPLLTAIVFAAVIVIYLGILPSSFIEWIRVSVEKSF